MTVLLLGATGFLGGYLADRLSRTMTVCTPRPRSGATGGAPATWLSRELDASDTRALPSVLPRLLDEARPDVVVNAIGLGYDAPRDAPLDAVNAVFPHGLAAAAVARRARVVHISTDGVFSGAGGNYRETDTPDPNDAYSRSKVAGELGAPHLTIRSSFFGRNPRGRGMIEWLVAHPGPQVEGFVDYRLTAVSAALLAGLVADALAAGRALEGVYHVGGEATSKYDVLRAAAAQLRPDVTVVPVVHGRMDRTLDSSRFFTAIARRRPALADSLATLGPGGPPDGAAGSPGTCGALSKS
jgi:dTDP-4-dehydrorhamnose reductase